MVVNTTNFETSISVQELTIPLMAPLCIVRDSPKSFVLLKDQELYDLHYKKTQSESLVLIDYSVSPFSNIESKRTSRFDKEYSMFAENLRSSFENLLILDPNGKSEVKITVCVIQNDGSSKSAVFNAVTLALLDAGVQMKDFLISLTVGLDQGQQIVDLNQEESKSAQGEITLSYQQRKQKIDYFELKTLKLSNNELNQLTKLAVTKAEELYKYLRTEIYDLKLKQVDL